MPLSTFDIVGMVVGLAVVIVVMVAVWDIDNVKERPHLWKRKRDL